MNTLLSRSCESPYQRRKHYVTEIFGKTLAVRATSQKTCHGVIVLHEPLGLGGQEAHEATDY